MSIISLDTKATILEKTFKEISYCTQVSNLYNYCPSLLPLAAAPRCGPSLKLLSGSTSLSFFTAVPY